MPGIGVGISPMLRRFGGNTPTLIGNLFTTSYSSGDYATAGAISPVYSSNSIRVTGANLGNFNDTLTYNGWITDREDLIVTTNITANVVNGTAYGFGAMLISGSYYIRTAIGMATGGANNGILYIFGESLGSTPLVTTPLNTVPVSLNDSLTLTMTLSPANVLTFTVLNNTTSVTHTISYTFNFDAPFVQLITPKAKIGFTLFGGDVTFDYTVSTTQYTYPNLVFRGDSKQKGYFITGTTLGNRVTDIWQTNNPTKRVYNLAGVNETSSDWANSTALLEILQHKPLKCIIEAPSNDIRTAVSSSTTRANLTTLRNALIAVGCDVWYQDPPLENTGASGVDLTPLIADGAAVFPANRIIPQPPTWNAVTDNAADGIHWNVSGNSKIQANQATYITL